MSKLNAMDPFHCGCSKCEVFWRKLTKNSEPGRLSLASSVRAEELNPLNSDRKKDPLMLKVGDHVLVKGRFKGVIQYVGVPERNLRANMYVGVKLENNCGYDTSGHRFIGCTQGHGTLVKYAEVAPLKQSSIKQKIYGNAMFPSYEHIVKARKLRAQRDPCFNLGGRYAPHAPQQIAGGGSGRRQRLKSAPPNPRSAEKGIPPNEQDEKNKSFAKTLQKLRFAFEEGKKFMQSENMA